MMCRIHLNQTGIHWKRIQNFHGLPSKIVASNAAENRRMVAQSARHHAEIGRRAAKSGPERQHIPQQLAQPDNETRLL